MRTEQHHGIVISIYEAGVDTLPHQAVCWAGRYFIEATINNAHHGIFTDDAASGIQMIIDARLLSERSYMNHKRKQWRHAR